ncbi:MAG: UDP-2,4-diacetamido-2,4,6-trideoxy-beta-L-altropyranose hydrolase [Rubrivivax sp.]
MKAVLRVDASAAIGSGHLSRCLTLARGLASRGFAITVATRTPEGPMLQWIEREGHSVVRMSASDIAEDVEASRLAAEGASLVVIDGYAFGAAFHEALRAEGRVVCVVDDLADAPVRGDAVLNGNLYAEELAYDVRDGARLLLGPKYALIRGEIVSARQRRLARPDAKHKTRLLVTMGGADPTAETDKALAALDRIDVPLDVRVIVGGANTRLDAIRERASKVAARHDVDVRFDVRAMGEEMAWCDVALAASGSTCLELACVGVAAVLIVVADNQRLVGDAAARRGLMTNLGPHRVVDAPAIAKAITELASDPARRRAMEDAQRAVVDGEGCTRAATDLAALAR